LPWTEEFDAAFCMGNSFGYLNHEGTCSFLAAVARALKPGGRFLLQTGLCAECLLPALKLDREYQIGDIKMTVQGRYHASESRLDNVYTFERGAVRQSKPARYHIYTAAEIRRLLEGCGLSVTAAYGSPARAPLEFGSPELLLTSIKRPASRP
jgi:hypothetical protein